MLKLNNHRREKYVDLVDGSGVYSHALQVGMGIVHGITFRQKRDARRLGEE